MLALLKQFKKREGHCNVPWSHTEDETSLGTWLSNQRSQKQRRELYPDRQNRLEELGFEWVAYEESVKRAVG
jgi:hypothetical protein